MREIKFRVRNKDIVLFIEISNTYCGCGWIQDKFTIFEQFTGLLDKNGKEIYEGDIVEFIDWRCSKQQWLYKSSQFDGYIKGFRGVIKWTKQGYFLDKKNLHNDKMLEPKKLERESMHNPYIYHNSDIEKKELSVEIIGNIYENEDLLSN